MKRREREMQGEGGEGGREGGREGASFEDIVRMRQNLFVVPCCLFLFICEVLLGALIQ
jgi:hypothetical protein